MMILSGSNVIYSSYFWENIPEHPIQTTVTVTGFLVLSPSGVLIVKNILYSFTAKATTQNLLYF